MIGFSNIRNKPKKSRRKVSRKRKKRKVDPRGAKGARIAIQRSRKFYMRIPTLGQLAASELAKQGSIEGVAGGFLISRRDMRKLMRKHGQRSHGQFPSDILSEYTVQQFLDDQASKRSIRERSRREERSRARKSSRRKKILASVLASAVLAYSIPWSTPAYTTNCPSDMRSLYDIELAKIAAEGIGSTNEIDHTQGQCALEVLRDYREFKGLPSPDNFLYAKAERVRRRNEFLENVGAKSRPSQTPIDVSRSIRLQRMISDYNDKKKDDSYLYGYSI